MSAETGVAPSMIPAPNASTAGAAYFFSGIAKSATRPITAAAVARKDVEWEHVFAPAVMPVNTVDGEEPATLQQFFPFLLFEEFH